MMDAINIFTIGEWGSVIHEWVNKINGELGVYLIFLLLGTGLFFTLATGFVQIRLFGRSIREMLGGRMRSMIRTASRRFRLS